MDKRIGYKRYSSKLNEFYCILNNYSIELYPSNKPNNFICELTEPIPLFGHWRVGLTEIFLKHTTPPTEPVYLLCSVVDDSPSRIANYHQNSILRSLVLAENATSSHVIYSSPYYIPVTVSILERIPLQLVLEDGSFLENTRNCHVTLHFKRDE